MIPLSTSQIYSWIAGTLEVSVQTVEQSVWGGLLLGFLFASVHLVTMLVTRWGDHHASSKSLLFSVLIHFFSGAGVLAFAPEGLKDSLIASSETHRIQIHEVHQSLEDSQKSLELTSTRKRNSNHHSSSWDTVTTPESQQFSRIEREISPVEQPAVPQRMLTEQNILLDDFPALETSRPRTSETPIPEQIASVNKLDGLPARLEMENIELPVVSGPAAEMGPQAGEQAERSPLTRQAETPERMQRLLEPPSRLATTRPDEIDYSELIPQRIVKTVEPEQLPVAETLSLPQTGEMIDRNPASNQLELSPPDLSSAAKTQSPESNPSRRERSAPRSMRGTETEMAASGANSERPSRLLPEPEGEPIGVVDLAMAPANSSVFSPEVPTPQELPSSPKIAIPGFQIIPETLKIDLPEIYQLRNPPNRTQIAEVFGGSVDSEAAVERSLAWLASIQEPGGYWDGSVQFDTGRGNMYEAGLFCQNAGFKEDTGLTGLAVLAFLGAGYTHEEGKYAETVRRALNWLIRTQRHDGYMGGKADCYPGMFYHGMAACALVEAYGMQPDRDPNSTFGKAVIKAVNYSLRLQNTQDGSWSHMHNQTGDMSMFGWHLMAIKSAENAGLGIPEKSQQLMVKFLVDRSLGEKKGLAAYHPVSRPQVSSSMTAEALFCKQMFGMQRDHESAQEAARFLLTEQNLPNKSNPNLYYWYFGTLAMYQIGGEEWGTWNHKLKELLVETQVKEGAMAGSWNPDGHWSGNGGRTYSTALAALSLEVYYRYLPLHRRNQE